MTKQDPSECSLPAREPGAALLAEWHAGQAARLEAMLAEIAAVDEIAREQIRHYTDVRERCSTLADRIRRAPLFGTPVLEQLTSGLDPVS